MNYCSKCGAKLNGVEKCPNCGYGEGVNKEETDNYKQDNYRGKNNNVIIWSAVGVIAAFLCLFLALNKHYSDSSTVVTDFKTAVASNDIQKLQKVLYCDDSRLEINDKNSKLLLDYFKNNPSYLDKLMVQLQNESRKIDAIGDRATLDNNKELFFIENAGKTLLFFPKYRIGIRPVYINLSCKVKDAIIKIDNENCCKCNSENFKKQVGPLLPANYKISAEYSSKFMKKSSNQNIDLINKSQDVPEVEIFKDLKYISVASDDKNAEVYVNGKDTGVKVGNATKLGPVDENCVVYAVSNLQGKNLKSSDIKVGLNSEVYLDFSSIISDEQNVKENLSILVREYDADFAYAVNYNNFGYIEGYLQPGSQIYNAQKKVINDIYNANIREDFINMEILSYDFNPQTNEGTVVCSEIYDITKGYSGTKTKQLKNTYKFIRKLDGSLLLTNIADA